MRWNRRAAFAAVLVSLPLAGGVTWDLTRPPGAQWTNRALLAGVGVYRVHLSPWAARAGVRCRFEPTCSHYGETALRRHGAARGTWLTVRRLARCGPWTAPGTVDPVPQ